MKKALVIGATGLVGGQLVQLLLNDDRFSEVVVFVRRRTGIQNTKLIEHIIDFSKPDVWQHLVKGDVLFSALGTTLKKAGSQQAQYTIDFTYQYQFAKAAAENGVPLYVLISSAGANAASSIFYSRMKGELEAAVKTLPFPFIHIIQPGLLTGHRTEFRLGEKLAAPVMSLIQYIPGLKKYRPIQGRTVAQAMINASFDREQKLKVHTLEGVFQLSEKK